MIEIVAITNETKKNVGRSKSGRGDKMA